MMKRLLICALALTLIMGQSASRAGAADPYEINVIIPLTGLGAFLGKNEAAALGLVEQNVNAAGGIHGRQIKFVIQDDQSNPQVAVQLLTGVIAKHVPIVLGSTLAAMCGAMLPLVKDGPVDYCFSSAIYPPKGSYMFSGNISTKDLLAVNIRYFRQRGWKRIALITTTDASGQDGDRNMDALLADPENNGVTLAAHEHFNPGDVSVDAQMTRIKDSGAQALIIYAAGTPFGTVLHGAADVGLTVPMSTTTANLSYAAMKQFSAFMPQELYFTGPPGVALDAIPNGPLKNAVRTFVDSAKAAGLHPDIGLLAGWDPALIVVSALNKLGLDATSAQIESYIENLHGWAGAYGVYDFRDGSQRGLAQNNGIVVRWDPAKDYWVGVSKFGGAPL
jgi:branched-chain amino acid transport system substrate-binding protein